MSDDWRDAAACRGRGPDLFFPAPHDERGKAVARAICEHCSVRVECAAFARAEHITDGVWGGTLLTIARDRTARGIRRSSKTLTAAERQQLVELRLVEPLPEVG